VHAQGRSSRFVVSIRTGAAIGLILFTGVRDMRAADAVLSFDAKPERVSTTGRITANDFTAEAWFKLSSYLPESQIFSQYDASSGRFIVGIKNQVAGMFIGGTWMTGSGTIPLNTWTHIAVTRSNTTWTIYINGQFYKSGVHNANPLANTTFAIGAINASADGFRGEISDVRAWNTVRTQAQIVSRLNVRLTGTEAGLAHYWPLNEGSGGTVADLVAGATGTLGAGVAWAVSADLPILAALPDTGSWSAAGGKGTVRLWGDGVLGVNGNLEVGYGQSSEAEFHLDGGNFSARAIIGLAGTRKEFWFNGGVFQPNTPNQTMSDLTAAYVSTNGAWIDTTLADGFDITQNLLHDPVLGAAHDGGLVKAGTNTLSLTGTSR